MDRQNGGSFPPKKVEPLRMTGEDINTYLEDNGMTQLTPEELTDGVKKNLRSLIMQTELAFEISGTDQLTKLKNRRAFDEQLDIEVERRVSQLRQSSRRAKSDLPPAVLVSMDINYLKHLNNLNYKSGDDALKGFADFMRKKFRIKEGDFFARTGGDEFFFILPGITLEKAREKLAGLREEFLDDKSLLPLYAQVRKKVADGHGNISKSDSRYIPPEQAAQIVPTFAFGCVAIDQQTCAQSNAKEFLITEANAAMTKDKKAWNEELLRRPTTRAQPRPPIQPRNGMSAPNERTP